jgi:hypothetical protein
LPQAAGGKPIDMDEQPRDDAGQPGYSDPDDALVRARREATDDEDRDRRPGTTDTMESWERERRMEPGSHDQKPREHERPLSTDELPDSAEETQG